MYVCSCTAGLLTSECCIISQLFMLIIAKKKNSIADGVLNADALRIIGWNDGPI
jgi:hypothetical protein